MSDIDSMIIALTNRKNVYNIIIIILLVFRPGDFCVENNEILSFLHEHLHETHTML